MVVRTFLGVCMHMRVLRSERVAGLVLSSGFRVTVMRKREGGREGIGGE